MLNRAKSSLISRTAGAWGADDVCVLNIEKDAILPEHSHRNRKQMSMLVDGSFRMTLDGETQTLKPGIPIPSNKATFRQGGIDAPCAIVEMFSPFATVNKPNKIMTM